LLIEWNLLGHSREVLVEHDLDCDLGEEDAQEVEVVEELFKDIEISSSHLSAVDHVE